MPNKVSVDTEIVARHVVVKNLARSSAEEAEGTPVTAERGLQLRVGQLLKGIEFAGTRLKRVVRQLLQTDKAARVA